MLTHDELNEMSDETLQYVIEGCEAMHGAKDLPISERILFADYMSLLFSRISQSLRDEVEDSDPPVAG